MADISKARVRKEYKDCLTNEDMKNAGVELKLAKDNFEDMIGTISGPKDSPYEGGTYNLEIKVPSDYPFKPPKVKFTTKIWHPNISSVTGAICLDILKDKWKAIQTLRTVMLSLQALMTAPEPDDPQDGVVAKQFKDKQDLFQQTAKYWATKYAGAKHSFPQFDEKVKQLVDKKYDEEKARVALSNSDWDIDAAIKKLEP